MVAVAAADEPGVVAHPLALALSWPVFGARQVATVYSVIIIALRAVV